MSMRIPSYALLLTAVGAAPSLAAEADNAQALHDKHCTACHGTEVYTRKDRRINTFSALERQVRSCEKTHRGHWSEVETAAVIQFLNDHFYHLESPSDN